MNAENELKKEYLKSYQKAVRREADILEEIQSLRADAVLPSLVNDGMPKGSSQSDLSNYAAQWDELMQSLKEERANKMNLRSKIEGKIRTMEDEDEKRVLRLRYIKGLKWEEVVVEMGYGWTQTHRIHSSALINFKME